MPTISKKSPFKEICKFSKLFDMVLQGSEQACGVSDSSNKIFLGIIPSKQISVGYHTPLDQSWAIEAMKQ
jgi:hypothetical protein